MKRILALLLVLLLLFCTFGCKEDLPPAQKEREWGEFYRKDGYVHNTMISAVLNTNELTAPVTELSYSLYDNTDFGIVSDYYTNTNDKRTHRLEIYENGEWKEAPYGGSCMTDMGHHYVPDADPAAHRKFDLTMDLHQHPDYAVIRYAPLERGAYRLIVTYSLTADDPGIEIPKRQHGYVLYFNVL